MKRVLTIISRAPYNGAYVVETLEAAMVTQAFDLPTSILFRNAGVNALRPAQQGQELATRTVGKIVTALSAYDLDQIYVCEQSLERYKLATLVIAATPVSNTDIGRLLHAHDIVMSG